MTQRFANRIESIQPSGTVQLSATLERLRAQGADVIDMAVGEPDFRVDSEIIAATAAALRDGLTRYGPVGGLTALRQRIASNFEDCQEAHVIVTNGAKQALYGLFQVLCQRGDEIIIPTPCWVSFSHQVTLAGGRPVLIPTVDHQPDLAAMAQAIGPRTVALLINSPNNPTGAVYPPEVIEALGDLCRRHDLWLISDEAYLDFNYNANVGFSPFMIKWLRERLITVRSFSKTYGMTGFRVGFAVAPTRVIQALQRLQSHLTGNVCTFAQHGALAALDLPDTTLAERRCQFKRRRDRAYDLVSELFDCQKPDGAFYLLPTIARFGERFESGTALAAFLLEQAHVAVVPGEHFFAPHHVRISFAASGDQMEEGVQRMHKVLTS